MLTSKCESRCFYGDYELTGAREAAAEKCD